MFNHARYDLINHKSMALLIAMYVVVQSIKMKVKKKNYLARVFFVQWVKKVSAKNILKILIDRR